MEDVGEVVNCQWDRRAAYLVAESFPGAPTTAPDLGLLRIYLASEIPLARANSRLEWRLFSPTKIHVQLGIEIADVLHAISYAFGGATHFHSD